MRPVARPGFSHAEDRAAVNDFIDLLDGLRAQAASVTFARRD